MSSEHKENSFEHHVKKIYKISNIFPQSPLVGVNFLEENDNFTQEDPLNECRKQFFKAGGRLSGRILQSFSSKLEKIVKVIIFFRNQTFLKKFCCSSRMHFWQLLWNFCVNVAEISAHSRKTVKRLKKFIEKTDRSKFSFGHIKCSFNEVCARSPKVKEQFKEFVFKNQLFQKYPPDTWKQFWQPNQINSAKSAKWLPQSLKTTEHFQDFVKKKKLSSKMSSEHKENSFDHHVKNFLEISKNFSSKSVSRRKFSRGKWSCYARRSTGRV